MSNKMFIIASREFFFRTRKKSFWVMTLLTPFILLLGFLAPILIAYFSVSSPSFSVKDIIVVDKSADKQIFKGLTSDENILFIDSEGIDYPDVIAKYPNVYGYLVIPEDIIEKSATTLDLYINQFSSLDVENSIKSNITSIVENIRIDKSGIDKSILRSLRPIIMLKPYEVKETNLGDTEVVESSTSTYVVMSFILVTIVLMFIMMYSSNVLQSIVDEKQNRVLELIVTSVKPFDIMMGKILGIAAVALSQLFLWILIFVIGIVCISPLVSLSTAAQGSIFTDYKAVFSVISDAGLLVKVIVTFLIMFIGGYLLYASMFAAVGSAVDNIRDSQQLQTPITLPLMLSVFMISAVFQDPNSYIAVWCSIIPFTSPVFMTARIAFGVPEWQWILSVIVLYGTFILFTWMAGRIYRVGIFMYGKKPSFSEFVRWIKMK